MKIKKIKNSVKLAGLFNKIIVKNVKSLDTSELEKAKDLPEKLALEFIFLLKKSIENDVNLLCESFKLLKIKGCYELKIEKMDNNSFDEKAVYSKKISFGHKEEIDKLNDEINKLNDEINSLNSEINNLNQGISALAKAVAILTTRGKNGQSK